MTWRNNHEKTALLVLLLVVGGGVLASLFSAIEVSQRSAVQALDGAASKIWWADTFPQWLAAIFTSLGTLGTLAALYWVIQTFKQTKSTVQAANEANSIASLDQRPWMDVEPPSVALTVKDNIIFAHVHAIARNVGRTVATGVHFTVDIVDIERTQNMGPVRDSVFSESSH